MKIHSIDIHYLSVPFVVPYRLSKLYGTVTHNNAVILSIRTECGLVGWGEANPQPPFTEETPESVIAAIRDRLAPRLLGREMPALKELPALLEGGPDDQRMARGAVDMALHDLAGKAAGLPVHALLGGAVVDEIPVLWPLGSGTPEEDIALVEAKLAEGYRTIMIKMGAQPVDIDIGRVRVLCDRFHPEVRFIADANQGWNEADALRFVEGLGDLPLALLEQPVPRSAFDALKQVHDASPIPVSADESVVSPADAERLADEAAADVFSIKVSKNGGIASGREIARIAARHGMRCLMNSMLECGISQAASLQLGCTLPNLLDGGHAYMSTLRLADDITDFSDFVADGVARVPPGPGLGITVDADKLHHLANSVEHVGSERVLMGTSA